MVFTIASYDFRTFDARKSYLSEFEAQQIVLAPAGLDFEHRFQGLRSKCIAGCMVADRTRLPSG